MSLKKIDLYKYSYFIANIIGANCLIGLSSVVSISNCRLASLRGGLVIGGFMTGGFVSYTRWCHNRQWLSRQPG